MLLLGSETLPHKNVNSEPLLELKNHWEKQGLKELNIYWGWTLEYAMLERHQMNNRFNAVIPINA